MPDRRVSIVVSLAVLHGAALAGCAGAQGRPKQADEAVVETSSSTVDMAEAPPSAAASPSSERTDPVEPTAPLENRANATTNETGEAATETPRSVGKVRAPGPTTLKGKLAGGDFTAKVALLNDMTVGREDVVLTIVDRDVTCETASLAEGDKNIQVRVPWKGGKFELSAKNLDVKFGVIRNKKNLLGAASKGAVEVLSAPRQEGDLGRIRISASAPKERIEGEIDVRLCMTLY